MVELIFEYYRDAKGKRSCLMCEYYFKHMSSDKFDVNQIMQVNNIKHYSYGQKLCIKHKEFVYMSYSCGLFKEKLNYTKARY